MRRVRYRHHGSVQAGFWPAGLLPRLLRGHAPRRRRQDTRPRPALQPANRVSADASRLTRLNSTRHANRLGDYPGAVSFSIFHIEFACSVRSSATSPTLKLWATTPLTRMDVGSLQ